MARYVYPAIFQKEDSGLYAVEFPDVPGCLTSGENLTDAIGMAEDALAFMLYDYERDKKPCPKASELHEVEVPEGAFVNYVACDTIGYQKRNSTRIVKKTLTIPEWLNELAVDAGVNFSQVLQESLKARLGVS